MDIDKYIIIKHFYPLILLLDPEIQYRLGFSMWHTEMLQIAQKTTQTAHRSNMFSLFTPFTTDVTFSTSK